MSSASYKNGHVVKNMTGGKGKKENLVHMRGGGGKQGGLVSYLSFFFIFHFGMQASQGCGTKGVVGVVQPSHVTVVVVIIVIVIVSPVDKQCVVEPFISTWIST